MKSATTDCNGKGLPLEAATGRWNGPGRQVRLDRESDWKLEWESVNGRVKGKLQKPGEIATGGRFCFWECKFNYGKKAVVTTRWLWEVEIMGMVATGIPRVVAISREATGKEDGGRAA